MLIVSAKSVHFPWYRRSVSTENSTAVGALSFDLRRNLINVLGEEHYPYAEFLHHELAANAWDADAQEVHIAEHVVSAASRGHPAVYDIVVSDDGNGMDADGLAEYFTVGESRKRLRGKSERLGRPLIGQIGVGKVAILKVARSWTIVTERHLGRRDPVRLRVEVDVDGWIGGDLEGFPIDDLPATGRSGTEIVLHGVTARLREDRIQRHLRRLPLSDNFRVFRNGRLVAPRQWSGIDKVDIATSASWRENGTERRGAINGEIWIRPDTDAKDRAYLVEPKSEADGLRRDPAGIEVRVNQDVITREFFGHETHGHAVNRLWGWVEADWLPILGNRTDYQRDSPAGQAFFSAVKPIFDQAYNTVRYERDRRAKEQRERKQQANKAAQGSAGDEEGGRADGERAQSSAEELDEAISSRYGEGINLVLQDKPELAPVVKSEPVTSRGRPAKDRIYPIRPSGEKRPFVVSKYGEDVAISQDKVADKSVRAVTGSTARRSHDATDVVEADVGTTVVNTTAGIRLRFVRLGPIEGPYRWNLDSPDALALDINTDHKLYAASGRPGSAPHRLHCAWIVALALAEHSMPTAGARLADQLEVLSYELYEAWGRRDS